MTALSINLPEFVAKESTLTAKKLGISRTEFIKRAIIHELNDFKRKQIQDELIKSFAAMKKSKNYIKKANRIIEELDDGLPDEKNEWWKGK